MTGTTYDTDPRVDARTQWATVARGSGIAIVVWAIATHVVAQVPIPPVIVIGIVFGAFVPFLKPRRGKLGLAYGILGALALLGNLPSILGELARPESSPAFILTLFSTVVVIVIVASGLGVFFGYSATPARGLARGAAAVFVVGALASVVAAANTPSDTAAAGDIEVVSEKVEFLPDEIATRPGTVGVWVDNRDGIHHTFTIESLDVDLEIPALKAKRVEFEAPAGTYDVICTVPGHESMTATLTVGG
ncbi:MAG: cupredoxin domain-containing protein [Acidimicrobiia bacterium]